MTDSAKNELLCGLLVVAIALIVYANSLGNGFVGDDHSVILNNPVLRDSPLSLFSRIDTTDESQLLPYYRPLTYLTYQLELRLHNFNPLLVRMFNILLHSANAFLVYRLARIFISFRYAALLAAILFAVHPLQSEAVDYNSARNTLLSCFFVLAAYLTHRRCLNEKKAFLTIASVILYLAALFSKETSLAVLPFILLLEVHTVRTATSSRTAAFSRCALYLVVTLGYLLLRWKVLSSFGIQNTLLPGINPTEHIKNLYATTDLASRLMQNLYIIPRYLASIINPAALSTRYIVPSDLSVLMLPLTFAWLGIAAAFIWLFTKGRTPAFLFGLSWLLIFWLPTCGVIYFPSAPMADRFLYAPAIGLWIIIADQTQRVLQYNRVTQKYLLYGIILLTGILAGATIKHNPNWKSDLTLSTLMARRFPDNAHAHASLGGTYIGTNDFERAESEFKKALELDPTMTSLYTPLGYIRMRYEDYSGALRFYSEALAVAPNDRDARINRALALEKLGRINEALEAYEYYRTMKGFNNIPGSQEFAEEKVRELTGITKTSR